MPDDSDQDTSRRLPSLTPRESDRDQLARAAREERRRKRPLHVFSLVAEVGVAIIDSIPL